MATPVGLEPTTPSLEGSCSVQMSYGAIYYLGDTAKPMKKTGYLIKIGMRIAFTICNSNTIGQIDLKSAFDDRNISRCKNTSLSFSWR